MPVYVCVCVCEMPIFSSAPSIDSVRVSMFVHVGLSLRMLSSVITVRYKPCCHKC